MSDPTAKGKRPEIPGAKRTGWFADCGGRDDEEWMRNMWQPCLQFDGMVTSFDIWFDTEAECERFIREQIVPNAGHMIDDAE